MVLPISSGLVSVRFSLPAGAAGDTPATFFSAVRVISHPPSETSMKTPLSAVKETFGEKAKLVEELETFTKDGDLWVSRVNEAKGLAHVSNSKLLRLHRVFTEVKAKFGTRAKLIDSICELEKRATDDGFKKRLGAYPVPRLYDMHQSATKRAKSEASPGAGKAMKAAKAFAKAGAKTAAVKRAAEANAKKAAKAAAGKKKKGAKR